MQCRNSRRWIAFAAVAAAACWIAITVGSQNGKEYELQQQLAAEDYRLNNPGVYRPDCKTPGNKEESDLCAQWKMARAARDLFDITYLQFVVSVFGLGGLFATLYFTHKALGEARIANKTTKSAFLTEQRAWIDFEVTDVGPFGPDENGAGVSIDFKIINLGKSPAKNICTDAHMILSYDQNIIQREIETFKAKCIHEYDRGNGRLALPNTSYTRPWYLSVSSTEIEQWQTATHEVHPIILFCVVYEIVHAPEPRYIFKTIHLGERIPGIDHVGGGISVAGNAITPKLILAEGQGGDAT